MNRLVCLSLVVVLSCEVKPSEINYGSDACHFCKMTIVDQKHAAQMVTEKGRSYKFDAIECMMNASSKWEGPNIKIYLVANYSNPGELVDATKASYLISQNIPSPMGEFLSAFENEEDRNRTLQSSGGKTLSWKQLVEEFR